MKLASDERIVYELSPNQKLIYIWAFTKCLVHGFASGFFLYFIVYISIGVNSPSKSEVMFIFSMDMLLICSVAASLGFVVSIIYHRYLIKTIRYIITNKRCIYIGGILRKVMHSANFGKITDVEISQNILEQVLKISTLSLFTAGTASVNPRNLNKPIPELCFTGLELVDDAGQYIIENLPSSNHYVP